MKINCKIKIKSLIGVDGNVYALVVKSSTSEHSYFSMPFEHFSICIPKIDSVMTATQSTKRLTGFAKYHIYRETAAPDAIL